MNHFNRLIFRVVMFLLLVAAAFMASLRAFEDVRWLSERANKTQPAPADAASPNP